MANQVYHFLSCALLSPLFVQHVVGAGECYFPGGAWAAGHYPCARNDFTSLCCPVGWTCFSNKLCSITHPELSSSPLPLGTSMRGTCTNPLWNENVCGNFCLDNPVNANEGSLSPCGSGRWCCQPRIVDGTCDCATGKGSFQLEDAFAQTIIGVGGVKFERTGTPMSRVATITMLNSISKAFPTDKSATLAPVWSSGSLATPSQSSATPSSPESKNQSTSTHSPPGVVHKPAFKAGVGAGAGVAGLGIVALMIFFLKRRRQRQNEPTMAMINSQDLGAPPREHLPRPPPINDPYHPMNSVLVLDKEEAPPRYVSGLTSGTGPHPDRCRTALEI